MNREKFIHGLLIAVLCYGQLIANIHVAGHLHVHDNECNQSSAFSDCHAVHHKVAGAAHHHPDTSHQTDSDCAIYHLLSSLNGGFWAVQNEFDIPQRLVANSTHTSGFIAPATLDHQPIRAPPANS